MCTYVLIKTGILIKHKKLKQVKLNHKYTITPRFSTEQNSCFYENNVVRVAIAVIFYVTVPFLTTQCFDLCGVNVVSFWSGSMFTYNFWNIS